MVISADTVLMRDPRCAGRVIDGRAALVTAHDNRLHLLNATGTTIWRSTDRPCSVRDLVDKVTLEFEVAPETASTDVQAFCLLLVERKILAFKDA